MSKHWLLGLALALVPLAARADDVDHTAGVRHIKALFITGGCCHDYDHQKKIVPDGIDRMIGDKYKVEWTIIDDKNRTTNHKIELYKNPDWYKGYDIVVHDECWADVNDQDYIANILRAHGEGKVPAVNLHCTEHCYRALPNFKYRDWFAFTGIESHGHGAQLPIAINFIDTDHPITKGLENWTTIHEELYNNFQVFDTCHPLAKGTQTWKDKSGKDQSSEYNVIWTNDYKGTRVFTTTLGHNNETCADPRYALLVARGFLWALGIKEMPDMPANATPTPFVKGPEGVTGATEAPLTAKAAEIAKIREALGIAKPSDRDDAPATAAKIDPYDRSDVALEVDAPDPKLTKIVLVAGRPSHGPGEHEFFAGCALLANMLRQVPGVWPVMAANGWPKNPAIFDGAKAVVFYADGGGGHPILQHLKEVSALMNKGIGLSLLHYAVEPTKAKGESEFLNWTGGAFEVKYSVNPMWVAEYKDLPQSPITRGVTPFSILDEWYFHMRFVDDMKGVTPLLTAVAPQSTMSRKDGDHEGNPDVRKAVAAGEPQHMAWAYERPDGGRGFGFTGAHYHKNWGNLSFRRLVTNAILWTAKVDVPDGGAKCEMSADELLKHMDDKRRH
jgi:type 1 glutamine amidotransferase